MFLLGGKGGEFLHMAGGGSESSNYRATDTTCNGISNVLKSGSIVFLNNLKQLLHVNLLSLKTAELLITEL